MAALDAYAQCFAADLAPGDVVTLSGPLGAGKTTFVRALVRALHGSDEQVSSPTFVFRQRYAGEPPVEHVDLYRIEDPAHELAELALDEAFGPDRITVVEWPEHADGWLPPHLAVAIEGVGDGPRTIRVQRRG
ncbi:MAG TPA: tRNA (adenosine(37)-N6)-threonylcarbamoyltransferase complex ATPase subunit type 1 TsaE [Candidatus Limnocylindria bacterium]|nr:tRNA (adenosine(37)-N6)-threonylcarbamoyltransferase complex ATPase subunit type 1 TsaE [Candidatus Limnocylindria bacterium]